MITLTRLSAALTLCLLPTMVSAQTMPGQEAPSQEMLKQHCTGDYLTHCGEFAPGGPEVEACFRRKAKLLSPNCASAIATHRPERGRIKRISAAR